MNVHSVTFDRPTQPRPTLYGMARVETDRGMYVFAFMLSGKIESAHFRYKEGWHAAFELPAEDARVCHLAIRQAKDERPADDGEATA